MCGILGRISIKNKSYKKNDFNIFHQALDLQHHRGPDGRGVKENNKFAKKLEKEVKAFLGI